MKKDQFLLILFNLSGTLDFDGSILFYMWNYRDFIT